ncbi:heat shock cognate 70 kDa protein-like isoform X1 [Senna tora]|uniref:Heat shock cognate 70 kDa protein-like isoform X1 n=1 Tax=Senna tora TaxID=362788 RepID=A0A834TA94_9FABA|nr:heat shock cognate 70 kDa protein-like isoform X1 [Senna tora]
MAGEDLFEGCLQRINEFLNEMHLGGVDFIDRLIDSMVGEDLFKGCLQRVNEFLNEVDLEGADVNHLILVVLSCKFRILMNGNSPYLKLIFTSGQIHLGGEDFIDRLIDTMVGEDLFERCLQRVNEFLNDVDLEGDYATLYCRISNIESKDYTNFHVLVLDLASSFMQISYLMNGNSPYLKVIFTSGQIHLGGEDFIDKLIDSMVAEDLFEGCLQKVNEFLNEIHLVGEDSIHRLIDSMVGEDLFEGCLQKVNQYFNDVDLEGADVNHLILVDYATLYCRISSIESKDYTNFYVLVLDLASSFMHISYLMNGNSPYLKLIFTYGQMHLGGVDFIDRLIDSMVGEDLFEGCL